MVGRKSESLAACFEANRTAMNGLEAINLRSKQTLVFERWRSPGRLKIPSCDSEKQSESAVSATSSAKSSAAGLDFRAESGGSAGSEPTDDAACWLVSECQAVPLEDFFHLNHGGFTKVGDS